MLTSYSELYDLHSSGYIYSLSDARVGADPGVPAAVRAAEEVLQPRHWPPGHHCILHRRGDLLLGVETLPACDHAQWNHVDERPFQGLKVF